MTTTTAARPAYTPSVAFIREAETLAREIAREQARSVEYRKVLRGAPIRLDPITVARAEVEEAAWQREGCRAALYTASRRGDAALVRVLTPRTLQADRRFAAATRALRELTA